jgi:hypothetical protein
MEGIALPKTKDSLREASYTVELENVKNATADLVANNAELLIRYIYDHKEQVPYETAEVRVGLVMKTLLKATGTYSSELMNQVIDDIKDLLNDRKYLQTFSSPSERKAALNYELSFINKYIQLDDLISLNTVKRT